MGSSKNTWSVSVHIVIVILLLTIVDVGGVKRRPPKAAASSTTAAAETVAKAAESVPEAALESADLSERDSLGADHFPESAETIPNDR